MGVSRRELLRGKLSSDNRPPALRPPWSLAGEAFLDRCTQCGDCVRACRPGILSMDNRGYPEVRFTAGECTFCGDCEAACEAGALAGRASGMAPWEARAVIDNACLTRQGVACQTCGDPCEARAIRFRPQLGSWPQPEVLEDRCTGCGACVSICPVQAISVRVRAAMEETSL
jgi:ferredoxin-type protein NapF